jgi:hypothetical protein
MSECKMGKKVKILRITGGYRGKFNVGDVTVIKEFQYSGSEFVRMEDDDNILDSWHNINNIELVKPKWTIYNNDKAWQDLSDKQKGKMLLAAHGKYKFTCDKIALYATVRFENLHGIYKAIKPEPVKPEPTMAELFVADWHETDVHLLKDFSEHMIAKGWTKSCK